MSAPRLSHEGRGDQAQVGFGQSLRRARVAMAERLGIFSGETPRRLWGPEPVFANQVLAGQAFGGRAGQIATLAGLGGFLEVAFPGLAVFSRELAGRFNASSGLRRLGPGRSAEFAKAEAGVAMELVPGVGETGGEVFAQGGYLGELAVGLGFQGHEFASWSGNESLNKR
ncbi:MAG: hypothetical protein LBR11_11640 [Deltaproteobacteria bacterium]|nr:hypothetical protein [Deltaproteobacteria bacterium]